MSESNRAWKKAMFQECPKCGEMLIRGLFADYEAHCVCGEKMLVLKWNKEEASGE